MRGQIKFYVDWHKSKKYAHTHIYTHTFITNNDGKFAWKFVEQAAAAVATAEAFGEGATVKYLSAVN